MQYTPTIQENDIADIYVGGIKLFSIRLGEINVSLETKEEREAISPEISKVKVPASFVPKCIIQIRGTLQPDTELTF